MEQLAWLVSGWLTIFALNLAPAFTPPSWTVMTAFRIGSGVPLVPLTLGGAVASTLGRVCMALMIRRYAHKLPGRDRGNAEALGRWFSERSRFTLGFLFVYCLGPFPSSALFVAAGAGRVRLLPVSLVFFTSRALADTFWVWVAASAVSGAGTLLLRQVTDWRLVLADIAAIALIGGVFRLPWASWLAGHMLPPAAVAAESKAPPHGENRADE